ncbi:MAG: aldehyde dehydrogenase [Chloroflexi bacterium]|jgi:pyrroloquinoline-quinone synthase|nr:aldehyde dehydrogenase [Chloroflexota bacterium]
MTLTVNSYREEMINAIKGKHSQMHPFTERWVKGELSRADLGFWAAQHYHYVGKFSRWLGAVMSECEYEDVRDFLLENMWEEEMGTRHTEMLIKFAEACGVTRDQVINANVLPTTLALSTWCYQKSKGPFLLAAAGLLVGLESQVPAIYKRNTPPLREKYGFTADEVEFFTVHITADEDHAERGFQILELYTKTDEERQMVLKTIQEATQMRWLYMTGINEATLGMR